MLAGLGVEEEPHFEYGYAYTDSMTYYSFSDSQARRELGAARGKEVNGLTASSFWGETLHGLKVWSACCGGATSVTAGPCAPRQARTVVPFVRWCICFSARYGVTDDNNCVLYYYYGAQY